MSYECRLVIVNDGRSDSVIKIYPAAMPSAKVWLNRVTHLEWWEKVQQNLQRYAAKGTFVPKPAYFHHDGDPRATMNLTEDKIPQVRLEGWELPELPPEDKAPILPNAAGNMLDMNKRIDSLEKNIGELVGAMTKILTATGNNAVFTSQEQPKPQTRSDDMASKVVPEYFKCCGIKFKNGAGVSAHKRSSKHKEVVGV